MGQIYLVRHGETAWNQELVFRGRADIPLSERGRRQAALAGQALSARQLAAIHSSPLSRAVETAEAVARFQKVPVEIDPAFVDLDYGQFQGMQLGEARERFPGVCRTWESAPQLTRFPGGEDMGAVTERAMPRLEELAGTHADEEIAVVTHRVVLKAILCQVCWADNARFWEVSRDTASISKVEYEGGRFTCVMQNDTAHLAALEDGGERVDF